MNFAAIDWLSISINLLLVIFFIVCLLMTLLILMQRPKQEGLGAAFGGGVTDQVFGASTTNVLPRDGPSCEERSSQRTVFGTVSAGLDDPRDRSSKSTAAGLCWTSPSSVWVPLTSATASFRVWKPLSRLL